MTKGIRWTILGVITLLVVANSTTVLAGPLSFDCDVPPDHFSSVSQDLTGAAAIGGTIERVQLRSGNNLPVVGARLVSIDGTRSAGVQFIAQDVGAKQFDIVLNVKNGASVQRSTVGRIDVGKAIRFSLAIGESGKVKLTVGGENFIADLAPMPASKAMVFCSTGQFKFSELVFSGGGAADRSATR